MSGLNCRPGDLAVIVYGTRYPGWLVRVLFAEPNGKYSLPDGYPGNARSSTSPAAWICECLMASHFNAPLKDGTRRTTRYGAIQDFALRPLRDPGEDARDETLLWLPVPSASKEVA